MSRPIYIYPAIFEKEKEGYSVTFPDFETCYTSGENLAEAIEMAKDVLCLTLYKMEVDKVTIPIPTDIKLIVTKDNSFASLIDCDTEFYKRYYKSKSVKKTLTIPEWLNYLAERENVNFSAVLQKALKAKLNITE